MTGPRRANAKPCQGSLGWCAVIIAISTLLVAIPGLCSDSNGELAHDRGRRGKNGTLIANHLDHSRHKGFGGNIPVNIQVKPFCFLHGKNYIATGANLTAHAEILDDRFKNASIEYQWSVKNKTITTRSNASEIVYTFDRADADNFLEVLVFHHPNDTGISNKTFVVRDAVAVADPIGKLFLEHGELLNITLKFHGTGPFSYCHSFCMEERARRQRECKECSPDIVTEAQEVRIIHYLHSVGNWTLSFVVDNIASRVVKSYSIKITENVRPKSVPYVPIVSSILAVIILLSGVALHLSFKRTIATETADFDFIRHDYNEAEESFWEEEQSFAQRVRYLLFRADQLSHDNSMTDSNLSGVRIY